MSTSRVMIVDDDPAVRRLLSSLVRRLGCDVVEADDGIDAIGKLSASRFDLVVTDLRMPRADGFAVLRALREQRAPTPAIMLTGEGSIADCVTAMRHGAANFLSKPFHATELEQLVRDVLAEADQRDRSPKRVSKGRPQVALIGDSPQLRAVLAMVEKVAGTDATVLLTGETGTGKEVVARLLHGVSRRSVQPFVTVDCGAIPESLIESELFGHAKGAFTGATERRVGKFVLAEGGTLFLDEVGELPLLMQVKLLRVLQEREVTPVGESRSQTVDLRIIAATHRNLEAMVKARSFREDLYYRLNVVAIEIPPLRERTEDIPALAAYFLDAAGRRLAKNIVLAPSALEALSRHSWPGNVRELENLIERLAIFNLSGEITCDELPRKLFPSATPSDGPAALPRTLGRVEDELIDDALRKTAGNKTEAAKLLGLKRTTLVEKIRRKQQSAR